MIREPSQGYQRFTRRGTPRRAVLCAGAGSLIAALLPRGRQPAAQDGSPAATPCAATTSDESRTIAQAYFDAFNAGDADALDALLAADYSHHGALVSEQDRELHKQRLLTNRAAFPDSRYALEDVIAQGDLVAIRHVFTGTLQGEYAGVQPTGQPVAVRGIHIHRIVCGRIAETWNSGDALGLLRQIGALPGPVPSPRSPLASGAAASPAASPSPDCPATTAEDGAALGRRWTEEAFDQHRLDVFDEIVAPDIVHHAGLFQDEIGAEDLKGDVATLVAAFPDIRFSVDVIVAEGDRVAVRWTGRGTHNGEFQGLAPTGRSVVFTGINFYRIACGRIVEGWSEPDALGLLRQLGVVPEATALPATPPA